jgi:hypothetical protein
MRLEPRSLSRSRAARHLPLGLSVLWRPAHQALPVPSPGGISTVPSPFAVQLLRCAPPFARAVRPMAANAPTFAHRHRPWRSLASFAVHCLTVPLRHSYRLGCPSVGGQRTDLFAPPPPPVLARRTALCGNTALSVSEQPFPVACEQATHSRRIATACCLAIARRSNRLVHKHKPPFFVSAANSFTSHTQPNPSFNLTRSGLRPPRAS